MSSAERKIDLLVRLALTEDEKERRAILDQLKKAAGETEMLSAPPERMRVSAWGLEWEIDRMLRELGMPCNLTGYYDVRAAIRLTVENGGVFGRTIMELYRKVAEEAGGKSTMLRVERHIRAAIERAWLRSDPETQERYFGNSVSPEKGRPTNSEFISRLAVELLKKERAGAGEDR